jgi:hypothetical protein
MVRRTMKAAVTIGIVACVWLPKPASCALITYHVTGTVDFVSGEIFSIVT